MNTTALASTALAAALTLASCGASHDAATPDGAVLASVAALRSNDVPAFVESTFTADQIAQMRGTWGVEMMESPDPKEAAKFKKTMVMLTAEGAEDILMALAEPQLAEMKPQMDMLMGMLEASAGSAVAQNDELTSLEKDQAQKALTAVVSTLRKNDVTDPARLRKAIGIVCKTARKSGITSVEDVRALRYEQALGKGSLALSMAKDVLEVYGFSIDDVLDSVTARTVSQSGKDATVELAYTLLGTTHTQTAEMVLVAGRWVAKREVEEPEMLQSGLSLGN